MDGKEGSHFNNIMILVVLVIVIGLLGLITLKNQPAPSPMLNPPRLSPTPIVILIETPPVSQPQADGMTLEEAQQQKPPPPSTLTAIRSPNGVTLEWKALRGSVLSYNIYRIKEKGDFQKIASRQADETTELKTNETYEFTDTTVTVGTTYTYAVSAVNIFQKESDKSEFVTITVPEFPL